MQDGGLFRAMSGALLNECPQQVGSGRMPMTGYGQQRSFND